LAVVFFTSGSWSFPCFIPNPPASRNCKISRLLRVSHCYVLFFSLTINVMDSWYSWNKNINFT
jgi:hypothetical protein